MLSGKIRYGIGKDGDIYLIKIFNENKKECDCVNSQGFPHRRKCSESCTQFVITEFQTDLIDIKLWCTGVEFKKVKPVEV